VGKAASSRLATVSYVSPDAAAPPTHDPSSNSLRIGDRLELETVLQALDTVIV